MALLRITSPHLTRSGSTGHVMFLVVLATLPGLTMLTYYFGWGNLINVAWATLIALGCEALVMLVRRRPVGFYLGDGSAVVTALLLGLAWAGAVAGSRRFAPGESWVGFLGRGHIG